MNIRTRRRRSSGRSLIAVAVAALLGASLIAFAPAISQAAPATYAGFEIDGDVTASTAHDWSNVSVTPYNDLIGNSDVTTYNQTDKESADPATWNLGANGFPAGKVDIGYNADYLAKDAVTGHWWWFAGWDRSDNTGSGGFLIELNQNPAGAASRQVGDVRIVADVSTGGGVVFGSARTWNGTAWGATLPASAFVSGTNAEAIPATAPWDGSPVAVGGQIGAKLFGEVGVDLTAAGIVNDSDPCHLTAITAWQLRGATGNSTSDGAPENLADGTQVHPFGFPASCGSLAWTKRADSATGDYLGGAVFTVHRTDAAQPDVVVTDNGAHDADSAAGHIRVDDLLPGTYSVTETTAPAGYIATTSPITGQVVTAAQVTSAGDFVNKLGAVAFSKGVAGQLSQRVGGATFTITAVSGAAAATPWNLDSAPLVVADNSTRDLDKTDGEFRISGLPTGSYSVAETGRPAGYDVDPATGYFTIDSLSDARVYPVAEPAPGAQPYVFGNVPRVTTLRIEKRDSNTQALLDGAQFIVCRDDLSTPGFDPAVDCATGQRVGTVTTGSAGSGAAELAGLAFGDYWVWESVPPVGYDLASPQYWPVSITPANDGAKVTLPLTNAPAYGSITWNKRALASDGALLGGATFLVHRTDEAQTDITVVDNGANDSDPVAGQFKVASLHIGTYQITETVPPAGYLLSGTHLGVTVTGGINTYVGNQIDLLGSIRWSKGIAGQPGSRLGGATFTVTGTGGAAADAPWNLDANPIVVVDNGPKDADARPGEFLVTGVPSGSYSIVETGRPTGYDLDPAIGYATVPAYQESPADVFASTAPAPGAQAYVFADQPRTTTVRVEKIDSTTMAMLDNAIFLLCFDSALSTGFDAAIDCAAGNQAGTLTTGSAGPGAAELADLEFGAYWLWESTSPIGYDLVEPRYLQVLIDAENDGALITVPVYNTPAYGSLEWEKRALTAGGALLGGATFTVHRTDAAQADVVVVDNGANDANPAAGRFKVASIHMGTYTITETTPPPGYIGGAEHAGVVVMPAQSNAGGIFVNHLGAMRWTKVSARDPHPLLGGAAFTVFAIRGAAAAAPWNLDASPITIADNGPLDADPVAGRFLLTGLPTGVYEMYETGRPIGYTMDYTTGFAIVDEVAPADVYESDEPKPGDLPHVFTDAERPTMVRVVKTDSTTGAYIDGAHFVLCQDAPATPGFESAVDCASSNQVVSLITGSDGPGEAHATNIGFGDYWLWESAPPTGYDLAAPDHWHIVIDAANDGETITVPVANSPAYGSLSWAKRALASDGELLGGAEFLVHRTDAAQADVAVVDNGANDADPAAGRLKVASIHKGTYTVTETKPPAGYIIGAAHTGVVVLPAQDNDAGPFVNYLGSMRWTKVSSADHSTLVGGAAFTVWAVSGAAAASPWDLDGHPIVVEDNGANDSDPSAGGFLVSGLPTGLYMVYETGRPIGYDMDATNGFARISSTDPADVYESDVPGPEDQPYAFADTPRTSTLHILKSDALTSDSIDGAVFQICKDSPASKGFDAAIDCAADNLVATVASGATVPGQADVAGLGFGDYWVHETAPPLGYNLPETPYQLVSIGPDNDGKDISVSFADPQKPMSAQLYKADAATGAGLAGATFELYVADGEAWNLIGTCSTIADDPATEADEAGLCDSVFTGLAFGNYKVVETAAPTGYSLPADPFYFSLGAQEAELGDLLVEVDNNLAPVPEPAIAKTADPISGSAVSRGDTVTYSLTLTNTGTATAVGDVVDTLPSVVTLASAGTGTAAADGRSITWSDVTVIPGATVTLTYSVTVNADAPAGAFSNIAVWTVGDTSYSSTTTHTVVVSGGGGGGGGGELPFTGDSGALPSAVAVVAMLGIGATVLRVHRRRR